MASTIDKVTKVENDARSFGFSYPTVDLIIAQIKDECSEVLEAIHQNESRDRQQEEIGDLIHATMALCFHQGFDIDETVALATNKFEKRMQKLKKLTHEQGLDNLKGQSLETLIALWKQAK